MGRPSSCWGELSGGFVRGRCLAAAGAANRSLAVHVRRDALDEGGLHLIGLGGIEPAGGDRRVDLRRGLGDHGVDHGLDVDTVRLGDRRDRRAVFERGPQLVGGDADGLGGGVEASAEEVTAAWAATAGPLVVAQSPPR